MRRFAGLLDTFWFAEAPATRLAMLRILIGAYALVDVGSRFRLFSNIADSSPDLFDPIGVISPLTSPMPAQAFQVLLVVTLIANVVFLLGWKHRVTGPLFATLLLVTLSYRNSWSMIYHSDNLVVFHIAILGFTRAADALSLDALERSAAGGLRLPMLGGWRVRDVASGWEYGYPVRLLCAVTAATYLLAAVAKIVGPLGLTWMTGEALRSQIAVDALRKELLDGEEPAGAFAIYGQLPLLTAFAIGSFALELLAPLAVLFRRFAPWWAIGAFLMHWGIYFIMEIRFDYHLCGVVFASFFPVERILDVLRPRRFWPRLGRASPSPSPG
jgi:hypothetical protein